MINGLIWNLFEYIFCFIEILFLYMFLNEVLERKKYIPKYAIYMGLIGASIIIFCLTWISVFSAFNMAVGYGLCVIIGIVVYKDKLIIKLFWVMVYCILLGLIDMVSANLISYITKMDIVGVILATNWYRVIYCIFTKLILFIFIKITAKTAHKALGDTPSRFWKLILGVFIVAIVSIVGVMQIGIILRDNEEAGVFLIIISLGILIMSIAIYQIFQYMCEYFEKEKQYEIIEYQNEMLIQATLEKDESDKEIRKIWHDFNNHISCIDMLLQMDNTKRAREYIYDMKINSQKINFEIKTGNEIADAVINQKYMKAKNHGIEFSVQGFLGEDIGINAVDLCALMSNGIDNAIEANMKIKEESRRRIQINMKPYKYYLLIEIINAVKEEIKNVDNLQTTKKDKNKHGFGMLSMKKIVEKYKGYLRYTCENNNFNLSIMLKIVGK